MQSSEMFAGQERDRVWKPKSCRSIVLVTRVRNPEVSHHLINWTAAAPMNLSLNIGIISNFAHHTREMSPENDSA
jgi:hypothetical protein